MKEIEYASARATVAEVCDLALNTAQTVSNASIEDTYLAGLSEKLNSKGEQMQTSIAAKRSKEKTQELANLDDKRDNLFAALKLFLRGYLNWDNNGNLIHAQKLYDVVKKHGLGINTESYEAQSALLESLLSEYKKPEMQASIAHLTLTELVGEIESAQKAFGSLFLESASIEGNKEEVRAASTIKKDVKQNFKAIADYLNAMQQARPDVYAGLAASIAELVNSLNNKIKQRNN